MVPWIMFDDSDAFVEKAKSITSAKPNQDLSESKSVLKVAEKWSGSPFIDSLVDLIREIKSSALKDIQVQFFRYITFLFLFPVLNIMVSSVIRCFTLFYVVLRCFTLFYVVLRCFTFAFAHCIEPISTVSGSIPPATSSLAETSLLNNSGLEGVVDILLPIGGSVLIVTELEYVGGCTSYKRRLAKFYAATKGVDSVVVCVKSQQTPQEDFGALQCFSVIELGLALIPTAENLDKHLPQLLLNIITHNDPGKRKKNPFRYGTKRPVESVADCGIHCLTTIPSITTGLAKVLLNNFGSVERVSKATIEELSLAVGLACARCIFKFFQDPK